MNKTEKHNIQGCEVTIITKPGIAGSHTVGFHFNHNGKKLGNYTVVRDEDIENFDYEGFVKKVEEAIQIIRDGEIVGDNEAIAQGERFKRYSKEEVEEWEKGTNNDK